MGAAGNVGLGSLIHPLISSTSTADDSGMLRQTALTAGRAHASRAFVPARAIASTSAAFVRQNDRVPAGHVRPRRLAPARRPLVPDAPFLVPDQPALNLQPFAADGFDAPLSAPPSRPVRVPHDPQGVLSDSHAAHDVLAHDTLVIVRQLEMLNVFMGFEQANRYAIHTTDGQLVGFLAEEEQGFISTISRQALRTHRPFRSVVMDRTGKPILWIRRPFAFINSRIFVHSSEDESGRIVGEAQQEWHPWRRRYNLFQSRESETYRQFARVDSGFLAWDFWLKDRDDRLVASINRNFRGIGREIFTDTGQYVIRFDAAGTELDLPPGADATLQGQSLVLPDQGDNGLSLDQRAMTLATAVSIDFDYFSRHSGSGGLGFPFFMWGGGDGSSDVRHGGGSAGGDVAGGAAAGAAGAAGAGAAGRTMSEDEQIYGRQPHDDDGATPPGALPQDGGWGERDVGGAGAEAGWDEGVWGEDAGEAQQGWNDDALRDPWGAQEEQGGGGWDLGDWGSE
ncbi:hypothetical protein Q5752_000847 [Cryptotrichosporon argae]